MLLEIDFVNGCTKQHSSYIKFLLQIYHQTQYSSMKRTNEIY